MLTRRICVITTAACALAVALSVSACEKVPLLAPTGSTITLAADATAVPMNGSAAIIAQVVESAGTPPHSGTSITFTTTLGTVEPSTATTDVNGRVTVTFRAGNNNGTATISAISGGATTGSNGAVKILVGSASVGSVSVGANPTNISSFGGSSVITATVFDVNGSPLTGTPVVFSTSAGSLSSGTVTSDGNGVASTVLTTTQTATVTAKVGAAGGSTGTTPTTPTTPGTGTTPTTPTTPTSGQASGTVTVTVSPSPTLVITPPTTPPSAGLPAAFTFAMTVPSGGAAIRSVTVNWGDGSATQNLGAISGSQIVTHIYNSPGTYTISATVTDVLGNVIPTATSVSVIPVPRPTVNVQATPSTSGSNTAVATATITAPTGVQIQDVRFVWNDGTSDDLGGASGTLTKSHQYSSPGLKTIEVDVTDSTGNVTAGTTTVTVS